MPYWAMVTPVPAGELSDTERAGARQHRTSPIP
jgi:hypothetical protein